MFRSYFYAVQHILISRLRKPVVRKNEYWENRWDSCVHFCFKDLEGIEISCTFAAAKNFLEKKVRIV